jgi:small-conductance mechanosensitive channel
MDNYFVFITADLESSIARLFGPSAQNTVFGSVTRADLGAMLCYLLLILALNGLAVAFIRHRTRRPAGTSDRTELHRRVFAALGRPLYILIWLYGIYFAATPVLLKLQPFAGLEAARQFLNTAFDLGAFAVFFWFLFRATRVLEARLAIWASRTPGKVIKLLVPLVGTSLRVVVIVVGFILALPILHLPAEYASALAKLTSIVLISSIAFLLFRTVSICQRVVLTRFDIAAADNLQARKVYTQIHFISRLAYVLIGLFAVAAILMLFQEVRHVGTSLLASAGIVGIVAGFAAQKALANLFAGFQIALAQPVRQDDVVVVEGEWGRVEEITLSYIVVRIWDDRRLILPLTYFIEKPFQNWTRTSAAVTGSVFLWVDYSFPVDAARDALRTIIEASPLWDKRFWNLQVSDASEKTMQLRVLATAADSSKSWDLRCEIREKLIAYIQRQHPRSLPRLRAELDRASAQPT